ncbi:cytochrome c [Heliorestis acidaminivorans]|uniref:Cytochrome c n=1 Tax=Heliorestis acidaminivorans TaxID=553427 RepID=A0A6I0F182_9FIRM|nr:cytochrome c [Heliorestis acidaminivorans]KAB2953094.1 cytochrome c [Heliorestis acidaminivorans]
MERNTREKKKLITPLAMSLSAVLLLGLLLTGCATQPSGSNTKQQGQVAPTELGDYIILSWQTIGMKCTSDNDAWFSWHTPGNDMWAQVIKRGDPPVVVTEGIKLTYEAPEDHRDPSKTLNFWDYAPITLGKEIPVNTGRSGNAADKGELTLNEAKSAWTALGIPISPFNDHGEVYAYPMFTVTASDEVTGKVLATTKVSMPVSAEIGCYLCHGGITKQPGIGLADETAKNILAAHDKNTGTNLLAEAEAGRPQYCLDCHAAANVGAPGKPDVLSMSAALHGKHAQYIQGGTVDSCGVCHPSSNKGEVYCQRDVHRGFGMDCMDCHGTLPQHAASVLTNELHKPAAQASLERLKPFLNDVDPVGRGHWINQPDCLSCHEDHKKASFEASSYNEWIFERDELYRFEKADNGDMMCASCHGSPHAIYPVSTVFGYDQINYQPESLQGFAGPIGANGNCSVCHTAPVTGDWHHKNQEQPFIAPSFANDPKR